VLGWNGRDAIIAKGHAWRAYGWGVSFVLMGERIKTEKCICVACFGREG
jgi:hypothetical protein